MSTLNAAAKAALKDHGVSQLEWALRNGYADGNWGGDACGCPDDRCIGFHHHYPDDCGCLPVLLEQLGKETRLVICTFGGIDRNGAARTGVTDKSPAEFAELCYRQGWRSLRIDDRGGREVGGIAARPDAPRERAWWGEQA